MRKDEVPVFFSIYFYFKYILFVLFIDAEHLQHVYILC